MSSPRVFLNYLEEESSRLNSLCQTWETVLKNKETRCREFSELLMAAIGQTRLVLSGKFDQFRKLIKMCGPDGDGKVTLNDLQGFWDLIHIQISELDEKFDRLEEMRGRWGRRGTITRHPPHKPSLRY